MTGRVLHFKNDSHFFKTAYLFHTNKTTQNNPFETQNHFETDFDHTHENPSKSHHSHNLKTTKSQPKIPLTPRKSSIPPNNHQINRKFNIHTEINTNIHTNVNTTTPFKTPTKPLQTPNISY